MRVALFIVLTFASLQVEAAQNGASFAWTPARVEPGQMVTLEEPIRAFQHLDAPKETPLLALPGLEVTHYVREIESQYSSGTRLVIDEVKHEVVGLPGFRKDRYTFRAHLPTCIKDCSLSFGFSRSKTIYNIDVSKISEHTYFPRQINADESTGVTSKN